MASHTISFMPDGTLNVNRPDVITPQQFSHRQYASPFVLHLLQMDSRIRLYQIFDDVEVGKGYFLTKEHIYFPYALPTIEHEIAHMVEMSPKRRWILPDWGLAMGDYLDEASVKGLIAGAGREARVRAIQKILVPNVFRDGYLLNNEFWADALKRRAVGHSQFQSYTDVEEWLNGMRERTLNTWNEARIEAAWKERLSYIQGWMETRES